MAWKIVQVRTIPSADTDYEAYSDEVNAYIKTNYDDTGKRLSISVTESDDGLVLTYTAIYRDEAARNEIISDPTIAAETIRRNNINAANGITREVTMDAEV
jgi:hypothetical protein